MSRPRMVCRADGQPMAWVFTKGAWLLEPHCKDDSEGMAWPKPFYIADWYYRQDPFFTADKAGTSYYPGTTPVIAEKVRECREQWGEPNAVLPDPLTAEECGFPAPVGAQPLYGARVGVGS